MAADASDIIYEDRRVTVRTATPADNDALCGVMRRVHLRSQLDVIQERDPDFFAMLRMHLGAYSGFIASNPEGFVGGCGSLVVRPGWLDGAAQPVGYLSDLRAITGFRGARALPKAYDEVLRRARAEHGAELFYTVIFDDNELAKRALLSFRSKRRAGQPIYRSMTPFNMTSVQFTLPVRAPRGTVRRATPADRDALVGFLAKMAKTRLMGDVLDSERFDRRLETWPDFGLDSFFLALDSAGNIVGTLAPWNTHRFKRTRVLGYYEQMATLKRVFNLGAALLRYPPLPPVGECLHFTWLSHLEIAGEDPAILRDLLRAAYRHLAPQRLHFMSAMIPQASPLERAFSGFMVRRTPMTLYSVTLPDGPYADRDFETSRPGFEMALS